MKHIDIPYDPHNADSFRQVMVTPAANDVTLDRAGASHFASTPGDMPPEKYLHWMIAYHLTYQTSLCGMVMVQRIQRQVVNVGLSIKQISTAPLGVAVNVYIESIAHKLTPTEMQLLAWEPDIEAYLYAVGQPPASTGVFKLSSMFLARPRASTEDYRCVRAFFRGTEEIEILVKLKVVPTLTA
ncbi:hypothetical protein FB451DRAFT_1387707 [Mycena latifolia]|nr:hypothetical protein FB451DRAFT_1387707 [Mycena latifolia]